MECCGYPMTWEMLWLMALHEDQCMWRAERVRFRLRGIDERPYTVELAVLTWQRDPSHCNVKAVDLRVMREKGIERSKMELTEWDGEKKTDPRRYRPIIECATCHKAIYGTEEGYEEQSPPNEVYYYRGSRV